MSEFVNCRAADHAFHSHFSAEWWNQNGVTGLQPLQTRANPVQKQIVDIDFIEHLFSAVVAKKPQGTSRRGSARQIKSIERGGQRTYVVGAGPLHVSHDVDA